MSDNPDCYSFVGWLSEGNMLNKEVIANGKIKEHVNIFSEEMLPGFCVHGLTHSELLNVQWRPKKYV